MASTLKYTVLFKDGCCKYSALIKPPGFQLLAFVLAIMHQSNEYAVMNQKKNKRAYKARLIVECALRQVSLVRTTKGRGCWVDLVFAGTDLTSGFYGRDDVLTRDELGR